MAEFFSSLKSIISYDIVYFKKNKCKQGNATGEFICEFKVYIRSKGSESIDFISIVSNTLYSTKTNTFTKLPGNWIAD